MRHETLLKVGLVALALVVVGTGFTIIEACKAFYDYDAWGKARPRLYIVSLGLMTIGALLVIAGVGVQYAKQQPVGPMAFIMLAVITMQILGMAWKFLAQAVVKGT
jgi:cellobiose-specific phosphotransferase system component IIC